MAWVRGETNTLTSASLDIDLGATTAMTKKNFSTYLTHIINDGTGTSNDSAPAYTFDDVSTASYANRVNSNFGSDSTFTSQTKEYVSLNTIKDDYFSIIWFCAIDGKEQLMNSYTNDADSPGAGNVPTFCKSINKYTGTSQFTRVDNNNDRGSSFGYEYDTDSNAIIFGSD